MKTDSTQPDSDDDEGLDDAAQGVRVSPEDADDSSSEIDEIGQAAGLVVRDDKPFRGIEEVDRRDQHRWELDPESADRDPPIYRPNQ